MKRDTQSRWKSKAAWGAVAALVLFVLQTYGLLEPLGLTEGAFNKIFTLLFAALTAFGIFNDPTNKRGF